MQYVRELERSEFDPTKFDYVTIADLETAWVVVVAIPPGYEGPPPHVHESDQIYYVLEGELTVILDGEERIAPAESIVFIPKGTAHQNVNRGTVPEMHLDLLVPPPDRFGSIARMADVSDRGPGTAYVLAVGEDYESSQIPGFDMQTIAAPATGCAGIMINAARVQPSSAGTSWHIHPFDQMYWVLEGVLHVEVADQTHDVPPGRLVVLPAGVPHRNWNPGSSPERHVAFLVPAPTAPPFDIGVSWEVGEPVG